MPHPISENKVQNAHTANKAKATALKTNEYLNFLITTHHPSILYP